MKLLQSLLILILSTIYSVQSSQLFLNFHPYSNSKCSGTTFGIGFSIAISSKPYSKSCQGTKCSSRDITQYCDTSLFFGETIVACKN